jgi:hypothetical protein
MKNITLVTIALLLACFALPAAQLSNTTLSAAITATQPYVTLASLTGVNGPGQPVSQGSIGTPSGAAWTILYVDGEAMRVTVAPATGQPVLVERGFQSPAVAHASGALVWIATPQQLVWESSGLPSGTCNSATAVNPTINVHLNQYAECLGGSWVTGSGTATAYRLNFPTIGAVAYTGLDTNGTAVGSTTVYCTEVDLPGSKLITGIGLLNGTTVTGNKRYVILYDSAGNALANSALAGQASVTASVFENYAFTSKLYAVGPAQYFGCLQDNSTGSTTVRMVDTGIDDNILTVGQTGATFGTVPALTVPTSFHTGTGPYLYVY